MYRVYLLLSVFFIFNATAQVSAQSIKDLIAKTQLPQAMAKIESGLTDKPNDVEYLALKSRVQTLQGDQIEDKESKIKAYENAQKTAAKIIELYPNSAKGYNRRAVAKGKLILYQGILKSRSLVLELRDDAKKSLELKNTSPYDKALANYLLGRAHIKLAKKPKVLRMPLGLAWASKKKGGEFLQKAAELSPETVSFNLSYAQWLLEKGDKTKAKKLLKKIESLKIADPSDTAHKKEAKKLLADS